MSNMSVNKFGQHSFNVKLPGRPGTGYILNKNNDLDMTHKRLTTIGKHIQDPSDLISLHHLNEHFENFQTARISLESTAKQYYNTEKNQLIANMETRLQEIKNVIETAFIKFIDNDNLIKATLLKIWNEDRSINKMIDLEIRTSQLSNALIEYHDKVENLKANLDNFPL